mgnify:CR=1 FL=1
MRIGVFGFGVPYGVLAAIGLRPVDITLNSAEPGTPVDRYLEPFLDPFAKSVLRGMSTGAFDDMAAIIFLRESPGAMIACQYAFELRRRGAMPTTAPAPIMLNILPADHPAADRFNRAELSRLADTLGRLGWVADAAVGTVAEKLDALIASQTNGEITGAAAFEARAALSTGEETAISTRARDGERIALLGAPLGNPTLHAALDGIGVLALDQQALDQAEAARGNGLDAALAAQAANPFAARQPKPIFGQAIGNTLVTHRIDRVVWQVDPNDDLWGWLMPQVRDLCVSQGVGFTDLGFLPRWPERADLPIREGIG